MLNKKIRYGQVACTLLAGLGVSVASACQNGDTRCHRSDLSASSFSPYVFSLSAGPVWAHGLKMQSYYLEPELFKTFTVTPHSNVLADGELFFGVKRAMGSRFESQVGLTVATTSAASISGDVWDDGSPTFNNYFYSYRAQHTHVAVKAKILADVAHLCKPYVSGSMGAGFNQLSSFSSTPTIEEAVPMPNFRSHTQTALTFTVGAGVERDLSKNWQVGLGYEFADWGPGHLSRGPGQTSSSGPSFNHFFTNGLMFNITYLA